MRVAGRVLGPEPEVEVAERDPAGLAAPADVDDARLERQQPPEGRDGLRRVFLLEPGGEREASGGDRQHRLAYLSVDAPWVTQATTRARSSLVMPGEVAERHRLRRDDALDVLRPRRDLLGRLEHDPGRRAREAGLRSATATWHGAQRCATTGATCAKATVCRAPTPSRCRPGGCAREQDDARRRRPPAAPRSCGPGGGG